MAGSYVKCVSGQRPGPGPDWAGRGRPGPSCLRTSTWLFPDNGEPLSLAVRLIPPALFSDCNVYVAVDLLPSTTGSNPAGAARKLAGIRARNSGGRFGGGGGGLVSVTCRRCLWSWQVQVFGSILTGLGVVEGSTSDNALCGWIRLGRFSCFGSRWLVRSFSFALFITAEAVASKQQCLSRFWCISQFLLLLLLFVRLPIFLLIFFWGGVGGGWAWNLPM